MTYPRSLALVLAANCSIWACGGGGSGGTTAETTTTTDPSTTTTEGTTTTETTVTPSTTSSDGGVECPFYNFEAPPAGNVGSAYEFIPDASSDPAWTPIYAGDVPGLTFGDSITGVPEQEGRFPIEGYLEDAAGLRCQLEMYTLTIGPVLPGDSSSSGDSGSDSGSDGSSDSGTGTGTDTGTTTGA